MGANPGWLSGYTPTAKEWNALWASKADDPNSGFATYLPTAGGTITGNLTVLGTINGSGGSFLPTAGGTLTGPLTIGDTGTAKLIFTPGATTSIASIIFTNSTAGIQLNGGGAGVKIVGGGPLVSNNGLNMVTGVSPAGVALAPVSTWSAALSGSTTTTNPTIWSWGVTDAMSATSGLLKYVDFEAGVGGPGLVGNRIAFGVKITQTAQSGSLASGLFSVGAGPGYQAIAFNTQMNATEGGTDTSQRGSYGNVIVGSSVNRMTGTATNFHEATVWEFDNNSAAPTYKKFGIKATQLPTDTARGVLDAAFVIENGGTSENNGRGTGLLAVQPTANFPYDVSGWIINAPMAQDWATFNTMTGGINFEQTFTQSVIQSKNFTVDGLGTVSVGNGYLSKTSLGVSLDTAGSVGPAEGATLSGAAIVSGGTSGFSVGLLMYDPYRGIWNINSAPGGVVTQLTCIRTPYYPSATPPANPVALTVASIAAGNTVGTVTVNMTWTQPNELSLQPTGGVTRIGSGMIAANGSVATTTTSLGPSGSHTTIQEWLQVKNPAGTIRYIPMY